MAQKYTDEEIKKMLEEFRKPPVVAETYVCGRSKIENLSSGAYTFYLRGERITGAHAAAVSVDGRRIDTRRAKRVNSESVPAEDCFGKGLKVINTYEDLGLKLRQEITIYEDIDTLTVQAFLTDTTKETETRYIAPFETIYPDHQGKELLLSLDQKMLLVPYDNDMWTRYESTPPRPGRTSYDVTAIFDEHTNEGLVIGAVDFDTWKNAIAWSYCDARCLVAYCGAADACTHDIMPHGTLIGTTVASARFVVGWYDDVRMGMREFGRMCTKVVPARPCHTCAPFGWNSYSALGGQFVLDHWKEAADFIYEKIPEFHDAEGATCINIDAARGQDLEDIKRTIEKLHARGQKAGWYAGPCITHAAWGMFQTVKGTDVPISELILKDQFGNPMAPVDSLSPLDVTNPLWEIHARNTIRDLVSLGIDYLKIDFLSHASYEGNFYDKSYRTGRQAINHAYQVLSEELDPEKLGREVFVSLSIAPIFPYFLGHARRSACDTFGHYDDVRYILNALDFGFWTCGTIYRYGDPDHCTLYHSVIDGRGVTDEIEAKGRYNASVISGTVLLLSDNFGPVGDEGIIAGARERVARLANNPKLNEIARFGEPFIPVNLPSDTANIYTLCHEGRYFAALFNFENREAVVGFEPASQGLPESGTACDLNCGGEKSYSGRLEVTLAAHDSVIFELK